MIRNYNGNVDRTIIRDLKKLCDLNAENERNLFEALDKKGKVTVSENLDPFTGCTDEMSTFVTLKNETEIIEYLKKDFLKRVNGYLEHRKPAEDYLLTDLVEFITENARFPEKDTMRQLEKNAEAKRLSELTSDVISTSKEITEQDIAKEILELAEEIMESRRENNPDDIAVRDKPYPESYWIEAEEFEGNIIHSTCYGHKDFRDYSCALRIKGFHDIEIISIEYSGNEAYTTAKNFHDKELFVPVTKYLITIHKSIVEMAKAEGIEFISEIDYDKFQAS